MATLFDLTGLYAANDAAYIQGTDYSNDPACLQFTIASGITVETYKLGVYTVTVSGDLRASIFTDSSGSVGTEVSGSDKTIAISTTGVKTFTLDTPKALSAGTYWLVVNGAGAPEVMLSRYKTFGESYRIFVGGGYYDTAGLEVGLTYTTGGGGSTTLKGTTTSRGMFRGMNRHVVSG